MIFNFYRNLSKFNLKIPGFRTALISHHRLPWFGINLEKASLRSFLNCTQWVLPTAPRLTFHDDRLPLPSLSELSAGSLYELSAHTGCSIDELFRLDLNFFKHIIRSLIFKQNHYKNIITNIFNKFNISYSLVPQGFFVDSYAIRKISYHFNVPNFMIENTFLNDSIIIEPTDSKYFIGKNLHSLSKNNFYDDQLKKDKIYDLINEHLMRPKSDQHKSLGKKSFDEVSDYVLFLAQVYTDASILFNQCEYSKNCVNLVRDIISISKSLNKQVIIKLHPKEYRGVDPVTFKPYRNLTFRKLLKAGILENQQEGIFIDYDDRWSTFDLIRNSTLALTINSQSGFEAMLLGKELIICANSYYSGLNSCIKITNKDSLATAMKSVLFDGYKVNDQSECWNFFKFIRNDYFIEKHTTNLFTQIDRRLKNNFYQGA